MSGMLNTGSENEIRSGTRCHVARPRRPGLFIIHSNQPRVKQFTFLALVQLVFQRKTKRREWLLTIAPLPNK
jgi:hypothetical protein